MVIGSNGSLRQSFDKEWLVCSFQMGIIDDGRWLRQ